MTEKSYMAVEDLDVYRKLCQLHLEVCDLTPLLGLWGDCLLMKRA
jgi:hypothetical protein